MARPVSRDSRGHFIPAGSPDREVGSNNDTVTLIDPADERAGNYGGTGDPGDVNAPGGTDNGSRPGIRRRGPDRHARKTRRRSGETGAPAGPAGDSDDTGDSRRANRETAATSKILTAEVIQPAVEIIHSVLANIDPCFAIDAMEARAMARAWAEYLRHTRVKVNKKTAALWGLLGVMAAMEVPRIRRAVANRRMAAKHAAAVSRAEAQAAGRVVPISGV